MITKEDIKKWRSEGAIVCEETNKGWDAVDLLYMKIYTQLLCALISNEPDFSAHDLPRLKKIALDEASEIMESSSWGFTPALDEKTS